MPGTLADPLEIAGLTGLAYLELGAQEWRVLLDAGAVPRTLKAASVKVRDRARRSTPRYDAMPGRAAAGPAGRGFLTGRVRILDTQAGMAASASWERAR